MPIYSLYIYKYIPYIVYRAAINEWAANVGGACKPVDECWCDVSMCFSLRQTHVHYRFAACNVERWKVLSETQLKSRVKLWKTNVKTDRQREKGTRRTPRGIRIRFTLDATTLLTPHRTSLQVNESAGKHKSFECENQLKLNSAQRPEWVVSEFSSLYFIYLYFLTVS